MYVFQQKKNCPNFIAFDEIKIKQINSGSLESWRIKETEESLPRVEPLVHLMQHDLSDDEYY